jgi:uncharacterized protein (UPF0335 family)
MISAEKDQLKNIVERVEKLEEEKASVSEMIKDILDESKHNGFDPKIIKKIIKIRKKPKKELEEEEELMSLYQHALGMLD